MNVCNVWMSRRTVVDGIRAAACGGNVSREWNSIPTHQDGAVRACAGCWLTPPLPRPPSRVSCPNGLNMFVPSSGRATKAQSHRLISYLHLSTRTVKILSYIYIPCMYCTPSMYQGYEVHQNTSFVLRSIFDSHPSSLSICLKNLFWTLMNFGSSYPSCYVCYSWGDVTFYISVEGAASPLHTTLSAGKG